MALLSAISLVLPTGRVAGLDAFFTRRRVATEVVPEVVPERPAGSADGTAVVRHPRSPCRARGIVLDTLLGEMAERLKAAVC